MAQKGYKATTGELFAKNAFTRIVRHDIEETLDFCPLKSAERAQTADVRRHRNPQSERARRLLPITSRPIHKFRKRGKGASREEQGDPR